MLHLNLIQLFLSFNELLNGLPFLVLLSVRLKGVLLEDFAYHFLSHSVNRPFLVLVSDFDSYFKVISLLLASLFHQFDKSVVVS